MTIHFDFKAPDYVTVFEERTRRLAWIRENPRERLPPLLAWYREHPADFINDWGMTFETRNPEVGLPAAIPFVLFPKQREWVEWVVERWKAREPGVTEKSRDCGISWLSVATACTLCLFYDGINIGFGSRKEEYVDKLGAPKTIFERARQFMRNLPPEFRGGWTEKHAPHMRMQFPLSGSTMTGEAGDNIGRGDRAAIFFIDESAHLERPTLVDASLSATTNCRQDISSANGSANPFAIKVRTWPKHRVFRFHWRDDPRKDDVWYAKQVDELDPVTLAQEVDIDYNASVEGVIIPMAWIQSAVDAHEKLGVVITGAREGALDVADEGKDNLAFASARGILLDHLWEWSGKGSDTFASTVRAFGHCDELDMFGFRYDADGLGAGVRGDSRVINEQRAAISKRQLTVTAFRGSAAVYRPEGQDVKGRLNKDFFKNAKAQAWWSLRKRFQNTYRAVIEGREFDPAEIISLSRDLPLLTKLQAELAQVTYELNNVGQIVVDKLGEGVRSPNLGDSVMILYSPVRRAMIISDEAVRATR